MTKTLLSLAGVDYTRPDLDRSALLMIDCQNEYADHALALPDVAAASAEAARTADIVRKSGGTDIHIQHLGGPGGAFDPDHARGAFLQNCAPEGDEAVVGKKLPNAFAGTDLAERLTAIRPEALILAGLMTHMCISATARAALDLGFGPAIVVAGACATRDLPSATRPGAVIPAATVHEIALTELSDRFAFVVPTAGAL